MGLSAGFSFRVGALGTEVIFPVPLLVLLRFDFFTVVVEPPAVPTVLPDEPPRPIVTRPCCPRIIASKRGLLLFFLVVSRRQI